MSRRVAIPVLLAAAALLPAGARAAGAWGVHRTARTLRADVDGRAETPGGTVAAVLRLHCREARGGTLCVSVRIEEAARIEGFDFAALEGASGGEPRLVLGDGRARVEAAPEGRWAHATSGAFAVTVCGKAGEPSEARRLAELVAAGAGPLELTLRSAGEGGPEIHARFPADSERHASRQVVERCASR